MNSTKQVIPMKRVVISNPYKDVPDEIQKAVITPWDNCTDCNLCNNRTRIVYFRGSCPCDVLFVGEAPGRNEDLSGLPFVGRSGQLLDQLIADVQKETKKFTYGITNIVCCIPTQKDERTGKVSIRVPDKLEAEACRLRLHTTIHRCNPKLIVTLGKTAKKYLKIPKKVGIYEQFEMASMEQLLKKGGTASLEYRKQIIYFKEVIEQMNG